MTANSNVATLSETNLAVADHGIREITANELDQVAGGIDPLSFAIGIGIGLGLVIIGAAGLKAAGVLVAK